MKKNAETSARAAVGVLRITSRAFMHNRFIPSRYTCDGSNVNPPLDISILPDGTQSLALVMEEPDAPVHFGVHWIAWNFPVTTHVDENTHVGSTGTNDFGAQVYNGPCPLRDLHRYVFTCYALDTVLNLSADTTKPYLEAAMENHILAVGELAGVYLRSIWTNQRK